MQKQSLYLEDEVGENRWPQFSSVQLLDDLGFGNYFLDTTPEA